MRLVEADRLQGPLKGEWSRGGGVVRCGQRIYSIVQIGYQRRQATAFAEARWHVFAGNSGRIVSAEAQIHYTAETPDPAPIDPPASLGDLWCGPGPLIPYSKAIGHKNWRLETTYGQGFPFSQNCSNRLIFELRAVGIAKKNGVVKSNPQPLQWIPIAMVGFLSFLPSNLHAQRPGSASQMPMPVPAAVSISRPTDDEIALAKSSLGKLLDQAEPAAKEVFKKYPDLVTVQPPRTNPCIVPSLNPGFRQKHTANVEAAGKGDIELLFMGDSITDWWWRSGPEGVSNPASSGRAVFDKYFGN